MEVRLRAAKLLNAVVDYCTSSTDIDAFKYVVEGMGKDLFAGPLKHCESTEKEVAAAYLNATGLGLGQRDLPGLVEEMKLADTLEAQKGQYVTAICAFIAQVTADALASEPTPVEPIPQASPTDPLGYIPTVAGIDPTLAAASASSSAGDQQLIGVLTGLSSFLSRDDNRVAFCTVREGIKPVHVLTGLLGREVGLPIQVYYQTVFCLWLLSFSGQYDQESESAAVVSAAMEEGNVARKLTGVLREISAEKVIRISLSTLRNLMKMSVVLRKDMVAAGLVGALEQLCLHHWDDEDIQEDLNVLAEALESEHASMSTFDVYRAEVLSGALEWSPAHRDEMFWQNNVEKLESNNLEVLRCIVRVLNESDDSTVLSVACHDLAQFVKYHPRGRQIAQSLRVKGRLMELMATGDGDVRRYALNGVQVLMITKWNLQQKSVYA